MAKTFLTIDFKKHKGQHLIILDNKIISFGKTSIEALKKASKKYPKRKNDFYLFLVPKSEVFVYVFI